MEVFSLRWEGEPVQRRDRISMLAEEERFGGGAHFLGMIGIIASDAEDAGDRKRVILTVNGQARRGGEGDDIAHGVQIARAEPVRRDAIWLAAARGFRQVWDMQDSDDPKSENPLRLGDFLPYRLAVTSNLVSRLVAKAYQSRFGLTIWEWRVVAILGEGTPMTAQAIADSAAMDKVSVSRAVRSLVERELVQRENHGSDGRARLLRLTPGGADIYREITPVALAEEAALVDELSAEEVALLAGLLDRLRRRAEGLMGE